MTMDITKPKSKYKKCSFNDPFIYIEDGTLSKKFCKKVIAKFEKDDRKALGQVGDAENKAVKLEVKLSTDLYISSIPEWEEEDKCFYKSLKKCFKNYEKQLPKKGLLPLGLRDTGYQLQRTNPGQFYRFHQDFDPFTIRYVTFIWYLNDIERDGYTEFIDGTRVQPKAGRFMMFPATWSYIHRGYPPKDEVKYICTGWISLK